jgi:hypothetical protein
VSYDIFVFDPKHAPTGHADFMEWFTAETECVDSTDDYTDPKIASEPIQEWFNSISAVFPAHNGPTAPENVENLDDVGDYNFRPYSV